MLCGRVGRVCASLRTQDRYRNKGEGGCRPQGLEMSLTSWRLRAFTYVCPSDCFQKDTGIHGIVSPSQSVLLEFIQHLVFRENKRSRAGATSPSWGLRTHPVACGKPWACMQLGLHRPQTMLHAHRHLSPHFQGLHKRHLKKKPLVLSGHIHGILDCEANWFAVATPPAGTSQETQVGGLRSLTGVRRRSWSCLPSGLTLACPSGPTLMNESAS